MVKIKPMTDNPVIRQQLMHPPKPEDRRKKEPEKKKVEKTLPIWAVDFDGTLSVGNHYPHIGKPNDPLIAALKMAKTLGHRLILWTCREGESLKEAVDWCRDQGLEFDEVNENIPETIERYGSNPRKLIATYFIDDRAFHFWGEEGIRNLCELITRT